MGTKPRINSVLDNDASIQLQVHLYIHNIVWIETFGDV